MFNTMSMQKRMIFATVLSLLFFVAYTAIFPQTVAVQPKSDHNQSTIDNKAIQAPALVNAAPKGQVVAQQSISNTEATLVTLNATNFTMKIDALGRISSKRLLEKKYLDENSNELEIINRKHAKPLEVRFNNTSLNNEAFVTAYTTNITSGTITPETPVDVVLTQVLNGVTLVKSLRFYADGHYDIKMALDAEKAYSIATGFQPNVNLDGFTIHGVLVEQGNDILTTIEDGEARGDESFKAVKIASSFDRYYATMFYTNKANLNVLIAKSPDAEEDPLMFIEGEQNMEFNGFVGPKDYKTLKSIDPLLIDSIEYGFFTFISAPVFKLLDYIHTYVGNWGWAIVILTLLIRLVLYPLSYKGMVSMQRLKDITPQLKELQAKHKGEPQKLNAATMALYKKHGANPLGGCLPMLLQLPIFFAIYRVILNSVEMQGAQWILWIDDLAKMDPYFVLPIIMGATMWYQQHITPTTFTDPLQAKMFKFLPIIFTFFFIMFPAALTLYWTVNNLSTIAQQALVNRKFSKINAKKKADND